MSDRYDDKAREIMAQLMADPEPFARPWNEMVIAAILRAAASLPREEPDKPVPASAPRPSQPAPTVEKK